MNPDKREILLKEVQKIQTARDIWWPFPGKQTQAFFSKADILLYGGAAGGGKTDLMLGCAIHNHLQSIIFRREYPQLKGIIERSQKIFNKIATYNSTQKIWRFPTDKSIEFGAVNRPGDENRYQGRAHDLKCFDEATHFPEDQFRFLMAWCRTAVEGQRTRVICASNPPTSAEGRWVEKYWAPWLDDKHTKPAEIGELRWFTQIGSEEVEVDSGEPFVHKGELIKPKSRTFISAHVEDNPFLMANGYRDTLQSLPDFLRRKMLFGDFKAGQQDHELQVIPTEWIILAQERWKNRRKPETEMSSLGVDVARGGNDRTILSPRYDNWFDLQIVYPGSGTPDGQYVASLVLQNTTENTNINVDVVGVGASVYDFIKDRMTNVFALSSAGGTEERDKTEQLTFVNNRALWWWRLREALDPVSNQEICLPDDRELMADLTATRWKLTARGIQMESKDDIKKRLGRSPDKGDSLVYAHVMQRHSFFGML